MYIGNVGYRAVLVAPTLKGEERKIISRGIDFMITSASEINFLRYQSCVYSSNCAPSVCYADEQYRDKKQMLKS
jgi:hypothetical protein